MSRMNPIGIAVWLSGALRAATAALAAEVTLHLTVTEQPDSSSIWTLAASTSPGDNDGIAGYNIEVVGNGVLGHHESPLSTAAGIPLRGFAIGGDDIPPGALTATQDSTDPSSLYYGVGSPDLGSRIPDPNVAPGLDHRQVPWPMPVLLAAGTGDDLNSVDIGASSGVNVWGYGEAAIGGTAAEAAAVCSFDITHVRFPVTIYVDDDAPADPWPANPTGSDPLEDGSAAHPFDAIQDHSAGEPRLAHVRKPHSGVTMARRKPRKKVRRGCRKPTDPRVSIRRRGCAAFQRGPRPQCFPEGMTAGPPDARCPAG